MSAIYNNEALDRPGVRFDAKAFLANRGKNKDKSRPKVLGGDVVIPQSMQRGPADQQSKAKTNGASQSQSIFDPCENILRELLTNQSEISGFGLANVSTDRSSKLATSMLDDQEEVTRKLERLPDMPMDEPEPEHPEETDDVGIQSDEEETAEIREALRKRAAGEEKETEESEQAQPGTQEPTDSKNDAMQVDEDEVDPLDAFMSGLELPTTTTTTSRKEQRLFDGEDTADLDAVGDDGEIDLDAAKAASKKKKKEMPKVDHSKFDYEPFRKSFYTEPEELVDMTPEDVKELRESLDNISVVPESAPKPIQKFSHGGFGTQVLEVIRDLKYETTTPIQAQALPTIMSGHDVIGIAKTGSGKTVAYILPMFRHVKDQRPVENLEGPIALILAPTRELATQIFRDCKPYAKALGLRGVCAYGGAPISEQIADCKRGADFIVCTPGRMIDLLTANNGRVTNLRRVTYVVLDEADRMFDLGFEPQMSKILNGIRPDRQTVLFSATFRASMEALAHKTLRKPVQINVGGRSVVAAEITQVVEVREEDTKFNRLLELLGEIHGDDGDERSLVFVERQETADAVLKELLRRGYPSVSIHGGREQIDRDQAISDFKAGIFPVMVATSVAARGLDVKQLKLVVNYDSPNHLEDYVHRCGRTGRAGNTGTAVTFVTPQQDRFAKFLTQALTDAGRDVPTELRDLRTSHEEKVKSGQEKTFRSGFGGRGIDRYDAARDAERARLQAQHKDGDEPDDEEQDEETTKEKSEKDKALDEMVKKAASNVTAFEAKPAEPPVDRAASQTLMPSALNDKLASAMKVQKAEPVATATGNDAISKAAAIASSINSRLGGAKNTTRPGAPADNRGPDAGAFHAVLEINDFPQKARWSVTNRTNVAKILEATGTSITTKGNFYAPGSEPKTGDPPKLYILVEGDTEGVVVAAMRELTKLLRDGAYAAFEEESKKASGGRYSVV